VPFIRLWLAPDSEKSLLFLLLLPVIKCDSLIEVGFSSSYGCVVVMVHDYNNSLVIVVVVMLLLLLRVHSKRQNDSHTLRG
jgi:hypothetical protein